MTKRNKLCSRVMVLIAALMGSMTTFAKTEKIGGIFYELDANSKEAQVVYSDGGSANHNYVVGTLVIPSTVKSGNTTYRVTSIGIMAFMANEELTSITIPATVKKIGKEFLLYCPSIKSISVDAENPIYDSRNNCNAIIHTATNELIVGCKNTVIPNTVTRIGNDAFNSAKEMTEINIPNSVTSIGSGAFGGCESLTSIKLPESITSIAEKTFDGCRELTEVGFPPNLENIGDNAFYGCGWRVLALTIPNTVKIIGAQAFGGMVNVNEITIPASVTKIDQGAFNSCSSLEKVTFMTTTPPEMTSAIFDKSVEIHVPEGCKDVYKNISNFKNCTIIDDVKINGSGTSNSSSGNPSGNPSSGTPATGIESVNSMTTTTDKVYSVTGQRLSKPVRGLNVIGGKKYMVK